MRGSDYRESKTEKLQLKKVQRDGPNYKRNRPNVLKIEAVNRGDLLKRCSLKFRKIHKKTPVLESLF